MQKQQKYHHSVTENGNLQLRIVTQYINDNGKVVSEKYSDPVTPADPEKMLDWDTKSIALVQAVTDNMVCVEFEAEKVSELHPTKIIGEGIEQSISYDRVIDDLGRVAVRQITRVFDEGIEVGKKFHRSWIIPGDTPQADVISNAIANKIHTPEVIQKYNEMIADKMLI